MDLPRSIPRWLLVLVLAILPVTRGVCAGLPKVERSPAPAWVEPMALDFSAMKKRAEVDAGTNPLLFERQVNVAEKTRYSHYATQFLTEKAVEEGARVSITFDPAYESLAFNRLIVHRDGKPIDRLARQEIKVLQRESRLDWHLYDGRLSGVIILEDIRVGDVLEYAYTIRGRNPIFGGQYMDSFDTSWSDPIHHFRSRLLWPSNRQLAYKSFGRTLTPTITPRNGFTEYIWEDRETPAVISDHEVPSWFVPWSWVQISEFDSWGAVARWAAEVHTVPTKVPDELEKELGQIALLATEQDRVLAALRYVQDNIRYLGVEVGENSHKPYPIETILSRRFGDCKDKALLLCTMLRRLGFEAFPALVETDSRQGIADWLPSALAFDHVVVQLRFHGTEFWLDPTNRDQGGSLEQIYFPAYGQALVIAPDTMALTSVRPGGFEESSMDVVETFDFQDFTGAANLRVRTTWRGHEADRIRSDLADTSLESIRKSNLNYYARLYPRIEAADTPSFRDDRASNVIVGDEAYRISAFWAPAGDAGDMYSGTFHSQTMRDLLNRPSTRVRTMPYALRFPRKATLAVEINLPRDMKWKKEETVIDDPAFKFAYSVVPSGARLTLHHAYEARGDHVPAPAMAKYLADIERARGLLAYEISIPAKWAAAASLPKVSATSPTSGIAGEGTSTDGGDSSWSTALWMLLAAGAVAIGYWWRRSASPSAVAHHSNPLHRCVVCGETEESNPALEFRVASNGHDYCNRHLPARQAAEGSN